MKKNAIIRIRAEAGLKEDLKKISHSRGQTMSQFLRSLIDGEVTVRPQTINKHLVTSGQEHNAGQPA